MTLKRLDHVSVVVDDLGAAIAFFTALGMTLEGEMPETFLENNDKYLLTYDKPRYRVAM